MRGRMYVDKNRGKRALDVAATNNFDRLDTNVKSVLPSLVSTFSPIVCFSWIREPSFLFFRCMIRIVPIASSEDFNSFRQTVQLSSSTYGNQDICLSFCGRRFSWPFIIANVQKPLLGADFLAHHSLLVDVSNFRLMDEHFCPLSIDVLEVETDVHSLSAMQIRFPIHRISGRFPI